MKKIELKIKNNKFIIVKDNIESSDTINLKFRVMAINKIKFIAKNTQLPFSVEIFDSKNKRIFFEIIYNYNQIDKIK